VFSSHQKKKRSIITTGPAGIACNKPIKIGKMDLFNTEADHNKNLLPEDGIVNYYGKIFSSKDAGHYLNSLLTNIEWRNDEAIIFGKNNY
jgi:hypothetical protein